MSAPKRPASPPDPATTTLITGTGNEDELRGDAPESVEVDVDDVSNDGATAFLRPSGAQQRSRKEQAPLAPRKGLQVSLPDEEPAPPPPPKRVAPPVPEKKGRRGAWWDEEAGAIPDEPEPAAPEPPAPEPAPSEADSPGATAFFRAPRAAKPPPPAEPGEPEVEPYRPVPADDYAGHVPAGPPRWKVWLRRAAWTAGAATVLVLLGLVAGYLYLAREVPTFDSVKDYHPMASTKVVAQDGTVVGQFYRERRTVVPMDKIPRVLVQAVISAEDKDFYKHPGFNPFSLVRAAVIDALSGRKRLGASTITQQVVKNFFLSPEKRWKRKLKEILLASRLEHNLSKDDILFLYLNHINFGKAHYGVEEASLYYFNKHVQDIDLGEAAMLAGLPQNPSRINPRRHPDRAKKRQIYVLDRMLANHFISREDHDREVEKPIVLPPPPPEPPGAWYVDEVRRQLVAQFGDAAVDTAGMTVEVAMDPRLQDAAEVALRENLRAIDKRQGWRGPEVKLGPERLDAYRTALARRLASVAQTPDQAWVLDLEGIYTAAVRRDASKKPPRKRPDETEDSDTAADVAALALEGNVPPDVLARAARARPLAPNEIYSGVVTSVGRADA